MLVFWISFFCIGFFVASASYLIARELKLMAIVDTILTAGLGLSGLSFGSGVGIHSLMGGFINHIFMVF